MLHGTWRGPGFCVTSCYLSVDDWCSFWYFRRRCAFGDAESLLLSVTFCLGDEEESSRPPPPWVLCLGDENWSPVEHGAGEHRGQRHAPVSHARRVAGISMALPTAALSGQCGALRSRNRIHDADSVYKQQKPAVFLWRVEGGIPREGEGTARPGVEHWMKPISTVRSRCGALWPSLAKCGACGRAWRVRCGGGAHVSRK